MSGHFEPISISNLLADLGFPYSHAALAVGTIIALIALFAPAAVPASRLAAACCCAILIAFFLSFQIGMETTEHEWLKGSFSRMMLRVFCVPPLNPILFGCIGWLIFCSTRKASAKDRAITFVFTTFTLCLNTFLAVAIAAA